MAKFQKKGELQAPIAKPKGPSNAEPGELTGSPKSYQELAQRTRYASGKTPSFLADPEVRAALAGDAEIEQEMEKELDSEVENIDLALQQLEDEPAAGHPFANGASIPFPYNGFDTVNFATCSKPKKDENRGCPVYAHCPLRDRGPFLLAYMNKRARNQIRHITCVDLLKTGMVFQPHIVLLPGINWEGTLSADYTPFADGRMPEPGPGKTKTPIKLTATKSYLPAECFPDAELVKQYQRLRRRGEIRTSQS
jgi:hypothetical protein